MEHRLQTIAYGSGDYMVHARARFALAFILSLALSAPISSLAEEKPKVQKHQGAEKKDIERGHVLVSRKGDGKQSIRKEIRTLASGQKIYYYGKINGQHRWEWVDSDSFEVTLKDGTKKKMSSAEWAFRHPEAAQNEFQKLIFGMKLQTPGDHRAYTEKFSDEQKRLASEEVVKNRVTLDVEPDSCVELPVAKPAPRAPAVCEECSSERGSAQVCEECDKQKKKVADSKKNSGDEGVVKFNPGFHQETWLRYAFDPQGSSNSKIATENGFGLRHSQATEDKRMLVQLDFDRMALWDDQVSKNQPLGQMSALQGQFAMGSREQGGWLPNYSTWGGNVQYMKAPNGDVFVVGLMPSYTSSATTLGTARLGAGAMVNDQVAPALIADVNFSHTLSQGGAVPIDPYIAGSLSLAQSATTWEDRTLQARGEIGVQVAKVCRISAQAIVGYTSRENPNINANTQVKSSEYFNASGRANVQVNLGEAGKALGITE